MNKIRQSVSLVSILLFMPNDNENLTKGNMYENYDLCSLGIQTLQKYYSTP